jgi:hypothetical protein
MRSVPVPEEQNSTSSTILELAGDTYIFKKESSHRIQTAAWLWGKEVVWLGRDSYEIERGPVLFLQLAGEATGTCFPLMEM